MMVTLCITIKEPHVLMVTESLAMQDVFSQFQASYAMLEFSRDGDCYLVQKDRQAGGWPYPHGNILKIAVLHTALLLILIL